MLETSARLLALLGLMQTRPDWTGAELATRLDVTPRTIRNDIERLRALGYPVDATRGRAGSYRLGAGGRLPPLLLDDEEAVAVAIGLRVATGVAGITDAGERALAKLLQVLPSRLRPTVDALAATVDRGPENIGTDAPDPEVDPAVLAAAAQAIRDQEWLRFDYPDGARLVEPYRLLSWQRRWYLVGRDPAGRRVVDLPHGLGRTPDADPATIRAGRAPGRRLHRLRAAVGGFERLERARAAPGRRACRSRRRAHQPHRRRRRVDR